MLQGKPRDADTRSCELQSAIVPGSRQQGGGALTSLTAEFKKIKPRTGALKHFFQCILKNY